MKEMTAALVIEQQALRGHFFTKIDKLPLDRIELPEFHCKAVPGSFLVQSRLTFVPHGDVCLNCFEKISYDIRRFKA